MLGVVPPIAPGVAHVCPLSRPTTFHVLPALPNGVALASGMIPSGAIDSISSLALTRHPLICALFAAFCQPINPKFIKASAAAPKAGVDAAGPIMSCAFPAPVALILRLFRKRATSLGAASVCGIENIEVVSSALRTSKPAPAFTSDHRPDRTQALVSLCTKESPP